MACLEKVQPATMRKAYDGRVMCLANIISHFESCEHKIRELGLPDLVEWSQLTPQIARTNSSFQAQLVFQNYKQMSDYVILVIEGLGALL